ncbi:hydrolase, alpha/beta fold family protein [Roseobacter sp. SK209-2-6]|nr:hydrolase, alpha/beta fold family protein [Roseobacter sp. SK209-2-6]
MDQSGIWSSEPVVLLPNMMCDARIFAPQLQFLSQRSPVLVAPLFGGDRIEDIAVHLLTMLPTRFALVGLSAGGSVALEILRRAPERVSRICLISTNPLSETPDQAAEREPMIISARTGRLEDALLRNLPPEALAPGPRRLEVLSLIRDMGLDLGSELFVDLSRALQRRRDQQATARRCRVPALVLCGEYDPLIPAKRQEFLAGLMSQASFQIIPGAGHLPTVEQPEAVNRALQSWLKTPLNLANWAKTEA